MCLFLETIENASLFCEECLLGAKLLFSALNSLFSSVNHDLRMLPGSVLSEE